MCWIVDLCCCWTRSASRGCSLQQLERQCRKKRRRGLPLLVLAERLLADWKVSCQFGRAIQREAGFLLSSVYLDDTHFTQSPSVHLQMIVLMRNSLRSIWQQLPLPHLWSPCFWLRVRMQLKTIKARLGQRCVLTTVRGACTRGRTGDI